MGNCCSFPPSLSSMRSRDSPYLKTLPITAPHRSILTLLAISWPWGILRLQIFHVLLYLVFITALRVGLFRLISRPSSFPSIWNFISWYFAGGVLEFSGCFFSLANIMISPQFILMWYRMHISQMRLVPGRLHRRFRFWFLGHRRIWVDLFLQFSGFVRIVIGVWVYVFTGVGVSPEVCCDFAFPKFIFHMFPVVLVWCCRVGHYRSLAESSRSILWRVARWVGFLGRLLCGLFFRIVVHLIWVSVAFHCVLVVALLCISAVGLFRRELPRGAFFLRSRKLWISRLIRVG